MHNAYALCYRNSQREFWAAFQGAAPSKGAPVHFPIGSIAALKGWMTY